MSDGAGSGDQSGWVVEPPEVHIGVAVGPDAALTPAIRAALDELVRAVEEDANPEVETFSKRCPTKCSAPGYGVCNPQSDCAPKIWFPCASKEICSIINPGIG
jgi:hypothetical protein